jgi:hypothetical protein
MAYTECKGKGGYRVGDIFHVASKEWNGTSPFHMAATEYKGKGGYRMVGIFYAALYKV